MRHHHELHDDGDEIPPPMEASYPPATDVPPVTDGASTPREKPGVLGSRWRRMGELGWSNNPPPRRWLLQRPAGKKDATIHQVGFLPLGKVGMLAAAGGAGKTMALVQLAVSVITGRPWLGHYTVPVDSRGPVLLALAEEDEAEAHRRLDAVRRGLNLSAEEWALVQRDLVVLFLAGESVQLISAARRGEPPHETDLLAELRDLLTQDGVDWRLVVLDPLSRWAGPETETDNHAATRFVAAVETLAQAPGGPTILLAHHTTKAARMTGASEATAVRGASGLTDGVRWVASLVNQASLDDSPALSLVKSNYSAPAPECVLQWTDGGVFAAMTEEQLDALRREIKTRRESDGKKSNGKSKKGSDDAEDINAF